MSNQLPSLKNIKCHFKIENFNECILPKLSPQRHLGVYGNFFVLKNKYTYTVFLKNNFVNVTGISNFDELQQVRKHLEKLLLPDVYLFSDITVDNLTFSGLSSYVSKSLRELQTSLRKKKAQVYFNSLRFPGLFVKFSCKGRIIVFSSGKYVIVGVKTIQEANNIYNLFIQHLS